MKKVPRAIKALQALNEEEQNEVTEFFKKEEEEVVEVKVDEKLEEKKKEVKEEKVVEVTLVEKLSSKLDTIIKEFGSFKEKVEKNKAFGQKAKPKGVQPINDFDTMFKNIRDLK